VLALVTGVADSDRSEERMPWLIAKGVARGMALLVAYVICGTLVSWVAFGFVAGDLWRGMGGLPMARAGGAGAVLALVVLLFLPQTWVSLAYVVGLPALYFVLGQKAALVVAASRVARGRSRRLSRWLAQKSFPACERLARAPGAVSVKSAARALLDASAADDDPGQPSRFAARWFLRKLARTLRIAEVYATAGFLEQTRNAPAEAQQTLDDFIDTRLVALTRGNRWTPFLIVAAVTIVVTLLHPFWVGHVQFDIKV
jgi:hypothetical protein